MNVVKEVNVMRLFALRALITSVSLCAHCLSHKPIASTHSGIQVNASYDAVA